MYKGKCSKNEYQESDTSDVLSERTRIPTILTVGDAKITEIHLNEWWNVHHEM